MFRPQKSSKTLFQLFSGGVKNFAWRVPAKFSPQLPLQTTMDFLIKID